MSGSRVRSGVTGNALPATDVRVTLLWERVRPLRLTAVP
jgi:hypothetical protein